MANSKFDSWLTLLVVMVFAVDLVHLLPANLFPQGNNFAPRALLNTDNGFFDAEFTTSNDGLSPSSGFDMTSNLPSPPNFGNSFDDFTKPGSGGGSGKSATGVIGGGGGGNGSKKPSSNADNLNLGFGITGADFVGELTAGAHQLLSQDTGSLSSSSGLTNAAELSAGDLEHGPEINSGIVVSTAIGIGGGPIKNNNYAQGHATAISSGKNTAASGSGSAKSSGNAVNTNAAGQVVINRPDNGRQSTVLATNFNNAVSTGNSGANSNSLSFVGDNLQNEFDSTKKLASQQDQLKFNNFNAFPSQPLNGFGQQQPNRGIVGNHAQRVLNQLPSGQQNAFNAVTGFNRASALHGNNNKNRRNTGGEERGRNRGSPQGQSDVLPQNKTSSSAISSITPPPVAASTALLTTPSTSMPPSASSTTYLPSSLSYSSITTTPNPVTTLMTTTPSVTTPHPTVESARPVNNEDVQRVQAKQQPGATDVNGTAPANSSASTAGGQDASAVVSKSGNGLINNADVPTKIKDQQPTTTSSPGKFDDEQRRSQQNNDSREYHQNNGGGGNWPGEHRGGFHHRHNWRHGRPSFNRRRDEGDDRRRRHNFIRRRGYYNN